MRRFAQNRHFYILFTLLLVMSSCVKEMDFDGVKDIELTPAMEIKLLEANLTPEAMMVEIEKAAGYTIPYIPGDLSLISLDPIPIKKPISLTSEERILKYLVDGTETIDGSEVTTPVLNFEFSNTIDREFQFKISLLDKDGNVLLEEEANGKFTIYAPSSGAAKPVKKSYTYTVDQIKKASYIAIDFNLRGGSDLRKESKGELTIDAVGVFNFKYDVSNGIP